jgi:spermidine synthase
MAVIWQKTRGGTLYQVRSAGRTRRLYTNGVLHSQLNPEYLVTGSVWDLLMLPAFFFPAGALRQVLVLGVGGGTVIRQLMRFAAPAEITGVELNLVHLSVAKRFFGLRRRGVVLHLGDASQWLAAYQGPPFDMIVDDLYGDGGGEPVRAVPADAAWFGRLLAHLGSRGALVVNFVSQVEFRRCGYFSSGPLARRFESVFRLTEPHTHNVVGAFLRREATSRSLRQRLRTEPLLDPERSSTRLRYRIRQIAGAPARGRV